MNISQNNVGKKVKIDTHAYNDTGFYTNLIIVIIIKRKD